MDYVKVGRTGVRVSRLSFGTMGFGAAADMDMSRALFRRCIEKGITFFDCANSYSGGKAEEILGACMAQAGCRDDVVIVSKVCRPVSDGPNGRGLSRRHIMNEVENSLKRLRTDRIDFYFAHHYDPLAAPEETLRAFDDLQRQGKIIHAAVSNWSAWRIATALGLSEREGLARFALVQPMYNLVKRQAEVELFPLAMAEGMGVMVYSPLASGLLTGLYGLGRRPASGRLAQPRYTQRYGDDAFLATADRFTAFARQNGYEPATLAVAWAMSHPAVTAPIVGADTVEQLDGSLAALDIDMTLDLREAVTALSIPPDESIEREVD
jgi:aryl-alcohol dehydrogenase-like predicted oxidoreductase